MGRKLPDFNHKNRLGEEPPRESAAFCYIIPWAADARVKNHAEAFLWKRVTQ
jgi:hypothetical protein